MRGVNLDLGQIPAIPAAVLHTSMIFVRLNCWQRRARQDGSGGATTSIVRNGLSQFDDDPIFVIWLATAFGFPTVAHVLSCALHGVNDRTVIAYRTSVRSVIDAPRPGMIKLEPTP